MANAAQVTKFKDEEWLSRAFLAPKENMVDRAKLEAYFTSADLSFTDTRLGGTYAVNPPPQFTCFADIRHGGLGGKDNYYRGIKPDKDDLVKGYGDGAGAVNASGGIGRAYHEAIDSHTQLVHFQFGMTAFNGMITFFTGFYDAPTAFFAKTGKGSPWMYKIGKAIGFVVGFRAWAWLAVGNILRYLIDVPSSKYAYMSPAMPAYWNRVNTILNAMAVELKLVKPVFDFDKLHSTGINQYDGITGSDGKSFNEFTDKERKALNEFYPDLFTDYGTIDVYRVSGRWQRLANQQRAYLENLFQNGDNSPAALTSIANALEEFKFNRSGLDGDQNPTQESEDPHARSFEEMMMGYVQGGKDQGGGWVNRDPRGSANTADIFTDQLTAENFRPSAGFSNANAVVASDEAVEAARADGSINDPNATNVNRTDKNYTTFTPPPNGGGITLDENGRPMLADPAQKRQDGVSSWSHKWGMLKDEVHKDLMDGNQFVTFCVEHLGTTTDTFSNQIGESAIAGKLNGLSASARSMRFSFSDGNTGIGLVDGVLNGVKNLAAGLLDGLGMSGLFSLFGSAFVDIPQEWKNSNAQTENTTYTIKLRSPYGSALSRLINLYYPLACILAAVLPLSTGRESYTSPFTCFWYHRGFSHCKYGMITSLSITAGGGSAGWTENNEPLGFDITFTVTSLTGIMHAPIQPVGWSINPFSGITDGDDVFMDYIARICGRSFTDMYYPSRRLNMAMTRRYVNFKSMFNISRAAQWMSDTLPGRAISGVFFPPANINR